MPGSEMDPDDDLFSLKNILSGNQSRAMNLLCSTRYKEQITILVIGDDASEKSAFISLLKNLGEGKGPFDLDYTRIQDNLSDQNGNAAPTCPLFHTVTTSNGCPIRVVDLPCFTNSDGSPQAHEAQAYLARVTKEAITTLDAVLIMIDGTLERPAIAADYMLEAFATMLPPPAVRNVGFLFSNCEKLTQKLRTETLPPVWTKSPGWAFQNPIPLSRSYRAQDSGVSTRQRNRQCQKIRDQYNEAIGTIDELVGRADEWEVCPTGGIIHLSGLAEEVLLHCESINASSVQFGEQRQKLVDLRANRCKLAKMHMLSRDAAPSNLALGIAIQLEQIQRDIDKAQLQLQQIEAQITQTRMAVNLVVEQIDQASLGTGYSNHLRLAIQILELQKKRLSSTPDSEGSLKRVDANIGRLSNVLDLIEGFSGTGLIPGLISIKSALKPIKNKKILTILLIGETGSGKTAFMSLLLNLFKGYGPFELDDENDESKESGLQKQESQTSDATFYTINAPGGLQISILDTPGLADTRGLEHDRNHMSKINKAIQEFAPSIDAVLFIANGTTERILAATNYALSALVSMLPCSFPENIGLIFTHCDTFTRNLEIGSLPEALRECRYWTLQNPLAYFKRYRQEVESGAPEHILKEGSARVQDLYDRSVRTLNEFLRWVGGSRPQLSQHIDKTYQKFMQIEERLKAAATSGARVSELSLEIKTAEYDLENTIKVKGQLQASKAQAIEYWERDSTSYHNVICTAPNCYSNCEVACSQPFTLDPAELARYSRAFQPASDGGGYSQLLGRICNRCSHRADQHRHYSHIHVRRTKELHPGNSRDVAEIENKERSLRDTKTTLQAQRIQAEREYAQARSQARSLAAEYNLESLNKSFASHISYTIQMLEFYREDAKANPSATSNTAGLDDAIKSFKAQLQILHDV